MKISDAHTWHSFTYTQLYPAVLGSLLFDALQFRLPFQPLQLVELSIVLLYVLDYLHLHADLRSDDPSRARGLDISLDAAIAILFGVAYWEASSGRIGNAYAIVAIVGLIAVAFNAQRRRRDVVVLLVYGLLFVCAVALAYWGWQDEPLTWLYGAATCVLVFAFALLVFSIHRTPSLEVGAGV